MRFRSPLDCISATSADVVWVPVDHRSSHYVPNRARLKKLEVSAETAQVILAELDAGKMNVPVENYRGRLKTESEHIVCYHEVNFTNNHLIWPANSLGPLSRITGLPKASEVAEIEGDSLKLVVNKTPRRLKLCSEGQSRQTFVNQNRA